MESADDLQDLMASIEEGSSHNLERNIEWALTTAYEWGEEEGYNRGYEAGKKEALDE